MIQGSGEGMGGVRPDGEELNPHRGSEGFQANRKATAKELISQWIIWASQHKWLWGDQELAIGAECTMSLCLSFSGPSTVLGVDVQQMLTE